MSVMGSGFFTFQSISPYGEKLRGVEIRRSGRIFQSISPYGEKLQSAVRYKVKSDFNPSPLTGRNLWKLPSSCNNHISIHLPLRGETVKASAHVDAVNISIHLPLRGETISRLEISCPWISIHLPLRGETDTQLRSMSLNHFNPSPLTGRNPSACP